MGKKDASSRSSLEKGNNDAETGEGEGGGGGGGGEKGLGKRVPSPATHRLRRIILVVIHRVTFFFRFQWSHWWEVRCS